MTADLKTAPGYWDSQWQEEAGRAEWLTPEPFVLEWTGIGGAALDLGCGVGRHAIALARAGIETVAMDASAAGLDHLAREAAAQQLPIRREQGDMTALGFADGAFDCVVSWNVIYHGGPEEVVRAAAEIARVLRPGGRFVGTMLSKRNRHFGVGREVAPDTWIDEAGDSDKSHPHFYCDAATLLEIFAPFEVLALVDQEHKGTGSGHWHWHVAMEKR